MLKTVVLKVYEYPIKAKDGSIYYGSYTIKDGIKPLGYKGEKLVQKFKTPIKFIPA